MIGTDANGMKSGMKPVWQWHKMESGAASTGRSNCRSLGRSTNAQIRKKRSPPPLKPECKSHPMEKCDYR